MPQVDKPPFSAKIKLQGVMAVTGSAHLKPLEIIKHMNLRVSLALNFPGSMLMSHTKLVNILYLTRDTLLVALKFRAGPKRPKGYWISSLFFGRARKSPVLLLPVLSSISPVEGRHVSLPPVSQ